MRLYRVTWVDSGWEHLDSTAQFHPLYVPVGRQGRGRFDNAHLYAALYVAQDPEGAVGETFGNLIHWTEEELRREKEGRTRCLVELEVPDDVVLVDLGDPAVLAGLDLNASDVVRRQRGKTRRLASDVWRSRATTGTRGLRWWSYWHPEWTVAVFWSDGPEDLRFDGVTVNAVEPIAPDLPAVRLAAEQLPRQIL